MRRNAAGQAATVIELPHAAQISFALFAYIAHEDELRRRFKPGFNQRMRDG